jgi:hypothetical protein
MKIGQAHQGPIEDQDHEDEGSYQTLEDEDFSQEPTLGCQTHVEDQELILEESSPSSSIHDEEGLEDTLFLKFMNLRTH